MRRFLAIGAAAVAVLVFSNPASATLLVYEGFDYTVGADLDGLNGGVGFSGAWNGATTVGGGTIAAGSLSSAGLSTTGNSALLTGEFGTYNVFRSYSDIAGSDGTTTWLSYVGQRQGAAQDPATTSPPNMYPRGVNIGFFNTEHATRTERVAIGNSSNADTNEWSLIPEGSGSLRTSVPQSGVPFTDLYWAVVRIDHHGDSTVADDAYMWLDPNSAGGEPSIGTANVTMIGTEDYTGIDYLRPFIGNESSGRPFGVLAVDEIRIGTDWASMTAVPEPSTLALLGIAGLGLLLRRRRR